jgi:hypothetical protein
MSFTEVPSPLKQKKTLGLQCANVVNVYFVHYNMWVGSVSRAKYRHVFNFMAGPGELMLMYSTYIIVNIYIIDIGRIYCARPGHMLWYIMFQALEVHVHIRVIC